MHYGGRVCCVVRIDSPRFGQSLFWVELVFADLLVPQHRLGQEPLEHHLTFALIDTSIRFVQATLMRLRLHT